MSTLADIRPGQVLGRYEFLAPIAQGGMASVWAARQWGSRGFSKIVAIKMMLPTISDDPKFERMFLDEARIASKIRHHHVVEILDLGEQNAVLYLVMEWVDGESLSVIRRAAAETGGVPVAVAVRIIADVCSGLHAAHELCDDEGQPFGLVHRDVSPQNILVGYDGVAKVLDFGVAKVAGRTAETTNVGHARGKPPYMAPEQALGHVVDRRADIFSIGIVLYQLIAGRHPFRGENDIATLHNIISEQPVVSPKAFVAGLTEGLERTMLRALERDPAKRYQTAREMELALESLLDAEVGRVRTEEIGRLVSTWLGARGEDRRLALREAIRRADSTDATQVTRVSVEAAGESRGSSVAPQLGLIRAISSEDSPVSQRVEPRVASRTGDRDIDAPSPVSVSNVRGKQVEPSSNTQKPETENNERTVIDLPPDWQASDAVAATVDGIERFRGLRRTGFIALLAMCVGALITWATVGVNRGGKPSPSVESLVSVALPLPLPLPLPLSSTVQSVSPVEVNNAPLSVESSKVDDSAPTAVPTVMTEPRTTHGVRPNNTQSRKRPSGPTYNLPPVPSPGF